MGIVRRVPLKSAHAHPSAFWRRPFRPLIYSKFALFFLYSPHPLIVLLSFYFRGLLNIQAASRSFTTHSLYLGQSRYRSSIEKIPFMFTPPPSPQPPLLESESFHPTDPPMLSPSPSPPSSPDQSLHPGPPLLQPPLKSDTRKKGAETRMLAIQDRKRQIAWRTGLTVIILPLLLALVTLVMRFSSRPLFLDSLAGPSPRTRPNFVIGNVRPGHSAHALHRRQASMATVQSDKPTSTSIAAGIDFPSQTSSSPPPPSVSAPTVPSSPPVLPTPFPQPFETTLSLNFTTNSCTSFFLNMTQSLPFRQCRPFSFLSQTSTSFLQVSMITFFLSAGTIRLSSLVDTYLRHSRTSRHSTSIFGAPVTLP